MSKVIKAELGHNVEWDKMSNRNNSEWDKMSNRNNVEWDKTSTDKMSNGTKCRPIIRFYIINLEKMSNEKNVEKHLDLPMSTSTSMCPCPCPCPSAHVHVHVSLSVSVSQVHVSLSVSVSPGQISPVNFCEFIKCVQ
jgi:hypothetical protein